ncbi:MAG TPA: hypothetical protein PKB01_10675 [Xanthobacteraceae bacterium]|nr:hypothetical protein [Xanthobacteraceae bacterium]
MANVRLIKTEADYEAALARVPSLDLPVPPRVLTGGSLYLAGAVLAANETPPR